MAYWGKNNKGNIRWEHRDVVDGESHTLCCLGMIIADKLS